MLSIPYNSELKYKNVIIFFTKSGRGFNNFSKFSTETAIPAKICINNFLNNTIYYFDEHGKAVAIFEQNFPEEPLLEDFRDFYGKLVRSDFKIAKKHFQKIINKIYNPNKVLEKDTLEHLKKKANKEQVKDLLNLNRYFKTSPEFGRNRENIFQIANYIYETKKLSYGDQQFLVEMCAKCIMHYSVYSEYRILYDMSFYCGYKEFTYLIVCKNIFLPSHDLHANYLHYLKFDVEKTKESFYDRNARVIQKTFRIFQAKRTLQRMRMQKVFNELKSLPPINEVFGGGKDYIENVEKYKINGLLRV